LRAAASPVALAVAVAVLVSMALPAQSGRAQREPLVEKGPTSIAYVPAPEPPKQKRKNLKRKNA